MTDLKPAERAALARIETLDDPDKLRALIGNARRLKSQAVESAAFLRLCQVQPAASPGTFEHDVWQSIHALEEILREERGKTVRLTRTRQKIGRDGEAKTVADLTLAAAASQGFQDLLDRGHPHLTFEVVALRHPDTFDQTVLDAARTRLTDAGLTPDDLLQSIDGA
jgi:hypothetical protein